MRFKYENLRKYIFILTSNQCKQMHRGVWKYYFTPIPLFKWKLLSRRIKIEQCNIMVKPIALFSNFLSILRLSPLLDLLKYVRQRFSNLNGIKHKRTSPMKDISFDNCLKVKNTIYFLDLNEIRSEIQSWKTH